MRGEGSQILIVEDSETQALRLRYLLEDEGWSVVRVSTAEAALEGFTRCVPALIVADYHLAGMQGDELCRRVRMNIDTRSVPVVILTAEESGGGEWAGLDSGADDYISKSVTSETLLRRIHAVLRNSGARLLAIDDSPTYLAYLTNALRADGYDVTGACSGKEGLERLANEVFECVLVDLTMPEIDGIEVCRRLNETVGARGQSIAVIMLTAHETKEDMTRGLRAGADDFVGKSSDTAVLKARIRALLRRKFFSEENRRIGEQLLRKELEVTQARAAQQSAEARALLVEELERKNKELESFSYSVSHDLRAPLRSIDGFSAALIEDYAGKLDATGVEYLALVRAAAQRMGELIDDLLDLSRVGRAELQRRPVDLSVLVRNAVAELQRAAPGRSIQVLIPEGVAADGDPRLLQIVIENLLGNAWKFTSAAAAASIEFGAAERDGVLTYFVRDNGAGFDMNYVERLFAPFQRLHSEAQFPGTGIGLATVDRIIQRHGGRVWAEGAVQRGATFYWTLPAVRNGSFT